MFNWFRRWRKNRKRQIFKFWDGRRMRAADPLSAWRSFQDDPQFVIDQHPGRIDAADLDIADESKQPDPAIQAIGREAVAITSAAVRRAFNLRPFESGGLTDGECLGLFHAFMSYLGSLKKSTDLHAISPSRTELERRSGLSTEAEAVTADTETIKLAVVAVGNVSATKRNSPCGC